MNLKELEFITTIAQEKSISRSAEKLYISQPALSLFLSRLENQMGIKLFIRSGNGLVPTYAGECYIRTAQKVMKLYHDFEIELCDISQMHAGKLRIGSTVHLGSYVFPMILPLYKERYPNIEITVAEGNSQDLERLLAHAEIDIALIHLPLKDIEAEYQVIAKDPYVMVFAEHTLLEQKIYYHEDGTKYIKPEAAANEQFVLAYPYQRVRQISDIILKHAGVTPNIVMKTSSVETALRLASVGTGITLMPESYIRLFTCPQTPHYCYMEEEYEAYWTFVAAYSKEAEMSKPAKEFIRILKENYR